MSLSSLVSANLSAVRTIVYLTSRVIKHYSPLVVSATDHDIEQELAWPLATQPYTSRLPLVREAHSSFKTTTKKARAAATTSETQCEPGYKNRCW